MRFISFLAAVAALSTSVVAGSQSAPAAPAPVAAPAPAAAPATPATPNPDDQIRCRSIPVTGSLVRRERTCKTVREWRRLADRGNDVAREAVGAGSMCSSGTCGGG